MQDGDAMSADEVKELQLALNQKAMDFKKKLKDSKGSLSSAETEKLIKEHRLEMDHLQEQLDAEKERMRRVLMEKMEARKRKKRGKQVGGQFFSTIFVLSLGIIFQSLGSICFLQKTIRAY